jgi:hypothetical protein
MSNNLMWDLLEEMNNYFDNKNNRKEAIIPVSLKELPKEFLDIIENKVYNDKCIPYSAIDAIVLMETRLLSK